MSIKVVEFLYRIGFTDDEVDEFYHIEPDGVDGKGNLFYGNDLLYVKVKEEQEYIDLRDTGEIIEKYWEKGWISGFGEIHRINYDCYQGRMYLAFPTRYKLPEFKFTKSLRRVLNKNRDLQWIIRPLRITPGKSELHDSYNFLKHGEMPKKPLVEIYKYFSDHDSKKMELCIFKGDKLIACSFFEVGTFSTYGNTAFWDLSEKSRSLGTLTLLLEIKYALSKNMFYHYLGNFYAQNPTYHYKTRFPGFQLMNWNNFSWVDFKHTSMIKEMLKQKLPRRTD